MKLLKKEKDNKGSRYYFLGIKYFEKRINSKAKRTYILGIRVWKKKKKTPIALMPPATLDGQKIMIELAKMEKMMIKLQNTVAATIDMKHLPKATGFSRILQLLNLEILEEIDRVCRKHNLKYWLSFGTILGAIRHGGYIPWDDDIDLCMMHDDWLKFNELAKTELKPEFTNIILPGDIGRMCRTDFIPSNDEEMMGFLFWKRQKKLFFGVDIFPVYWLKDEISTEDATKFIQKEAQVKLQKVRKVNHNLRERERIQIETDEALAPIIATSPAKRVFASLHCIHSSPYIWHADDIFPLQEINFEEKKFLAPKEPELIMWQEHGNFWEPVISHTHLSINQISREEMLKLLTHAKRLGIMDNQNS